MPALSAYTNTENTSLVVLKQKGFQVWWDSESEQYMAEKDGWDFMASGATELLGVVAIFEHVKPACYAEYWWRINEPWLRDKMPPKPVPYEPVWKRE